jgi:hypothetical protein
LPSASRDTTALRMLGALVGLATTAGFGLAFAITALE